MAEIYRFLFVLLFHLGRGKLTDSTPLKLCCEPDYYFDTTSFSCLPSNQTLFATFYQPDGSLAEEGFSMTNVTSMNACDSYQLQSSEFVLHTDGSITVGAKDKSKIYNVQASGYCLLWMKSDPGYSFSSLICFPEKKTATISKFYLITHGVVLPIGMAISALFLVGTLLLYSLVPELRDQLGKSFMCSIAWLALSKVLAVVIKTSSKELPSWLCIFSGMAMHFCFLQAFFWLNVISILVFASLWLRSKKFCLDSKSGFIVSCVYAFGIPAVILSIVVIHDFSTLFDDLLIPTPGFGVASCWFSNREAQLFYFYAPIAILVSINVILFCLSACKLCAMSSNISSVHFKQYLKLFLLMGVSWIFEVLSFLFGNPSVASASSVIWFILDLFNALSGVFIFIFFACRQPALARAYANVRGQPSDGKRFATAHVDDLSKTDFTNQDVKLVGSNDCPIQSTQP